MPYSVDKPGDLPENAKNLPPKLQRMWVHVWNSVFQRSKDEQMAFKSANKMVSTAKKSGSDNDYEGEYDEEALNSYVEGELEPKPGRPYLARLREMLGSLKGKSVDDAMITGIMRSSAGWAGAQKRHGKRASEVTDFRLLYQLAESPTSVNILPVPGSYKHPAYGNIKITAERNQRFVDNFNNKIYQDKLPIDAEHQSKLSGALGWITSLVQNEDGSVDGGVEWTDRGTQMIESDRFKYFSPEWYDEWVDPATEKKHQDVLIGGAVTTRPFFKDQSLKPLVASELLLNEEGDDDDDEEYEFEPEEAFAEDGSILQSFAVWTSAYMASLPDSSYLYIAPGGTKKDGKTDQDHRFFPYADENGTVDIPHVRNAIARAPQASLPPEVKKNVQEKARGILQKKQASQPDVGDVHVPAIMKPKETKMSEADAQKFTEEIEALKTQITEVKTAAEATTTALTEERTKREAAEQRVQQLEGSARRARFAELIRSPNRWYGDPEKHVTRLEKLASAFGEDSDDFKEYVAEQAALAKNLAESEHFKEIGTEQHSEAESGFRGALKKYQEAHPEKSEADAMTAVLEANPNFYAEYRRTMTEAAAKGAQDGVKI